MNPLRLLKLEASAIFRLFRLHFVVRWRAARGGACIGDLLYVTERHFTRFELLGQIGVNADTNTRITAIRCCKKLRSMILLKGGVQILRK